MKEITHVPQIQSINNLQHISFSDYKEESIRCCLCKVPTRLIKIKGSRQNKDQEKQMIVGAFFQDLLFSLGDKERECVDNESDYRRVYAALIDKYKKKLVNTKHEKFFDFWVELDAIYTTCINKVKEEPPSYREKALFSQDNIIKGVVDEISITESFINVKEYKCVKNLENLYKDQYIDQVHIYSGLIKETYGKMPDKVFIEGLGNKIIDVIISKDRINKLFYNLKSRYQELNDAIVNSSDLIDMCRLSDYCQHCHLNLFCPALLDNYALPYFPPTNTILEFEIIKDHRASNDPIKARVSNGLYVKDKDIILKGEEDILNQLKQGERYISNHIKLNTCSTTATLTESSNVYRK